MMNTLLLIMAMLLLLIILTMVAKFAYSNLWKPLKLHLHFKNQGIVGPKHRPIYGNTEEIKMLMAEAEANKPIPIDGGSVHRVLPHIHKWTAMYGKTFVFWFGNKPKLNVSEPDMIKELLMNHNSSVDRVPLSPLAKDLFGQGIPGIYGKVWALHKKFANQAFTMERVKAWVPDIVHSTAVLLKKWEEESGGRDECEIDVYQQLQSLSADIISKTAFGSSYEDGKRIFELQDQQTTLTMQAMRSIYFPGLRFLPTGKNRLRWKLEKEIRDSVRKIIEKNNTSSGDDNDKNPNNFVRILLSASKNHDEGKDQLKFGVEEIIDECKTFYFGGKETTANMMTWTLILLASHHDWQDRAREEVLRVSKGNDRFPTAENLNQLKIVTMVLNETLRLYPIGDLSRRTSKDIKLGNISVPAETEFNIPVLYVQTDPEIWGKDSTEFKPERFAEGGKHLGAFIPFGLGPRTCPGQNLAMVELKIVVAMILRQFTFELSPSYTHAPVQLLTMQPQYGAHIIFKKI